MVSIRPELEAVLFDMDGVVTNTAALHFNAWKNLFEAELPLIAPQSRTGFSRDDYRRYVDGRTREQGVATFLASRGITNDDGRGATEGTPTATIGRLSAKKQELFEALLADQGVEVLPGVVSFISSCRDAGLRVGLVTSSTNADRILTAAGINALFDTIVTGVDARIHALASKPDPAMFLEGCRRLGTTPRLTALIEDSTVGTVAGVAGGFGLVIGIGKSGPRESDLFAAGADLVAVGLSKLQVTGRLLHLGPTARRRYDSDPWMLRYFSFDPSEEGTREALCTLANGYWGTRGASELDRSDGVHYAGTYFAGVYDAVTIDADGLKLVDEELVNAPNWLPLSFRIDDDDWVRSDAIHLLHFYQELDLKRGILTRSMIFRDARSRVTMVTSSRLVSQASPKLAAQRFEVLAVNWNGVLTVNGQIDGRMSNSHGVAHHAAEHAHLAPVAAHRAGEAGMCLEMVTKVTDVRIAVAARLAVMTGEQRLSPRFDYSDDQQAVVALQCVVKIGHGEAIVVQKVVAACTSRDRAITSPAKAAISEVLRAADFATIRAEHVKAWRRRWRLFDVRVSAKKPIGLAVHLNIFHVLQSLAPPEADIDAGIPARGLHGEGYDGHIFWDELFVYPMLTLRSPRDARALLGYRYRRLPEARAAARSIGKAGAMFPWQSGTDGSDVTPRRLFNPRNAIWMPDNSFQQRHVGLAIAFSAWQFYEATGDRQFLVDQGAALIVEVARFFASLATPDASSSQYSIRHVMGPDEFHDGYPGGPAEGVTDNTYTNVMTAWVLRRASDVTQILRSVPGSAAGPPGAATNQELAHWDHIATHLRLVFNRDGTLSQFAGYDDLEPIDLNDYVERFGRIGRLDLILNASNDSTNNYQVSKQPDALMLLYLLSAEELRELIADMGYSLSPDVIRRTVERYTACSTYGSTLSNVVHSWIEARYDRTLSWQFLATSLNSDLGDLQRGTTREGVHIAAMAGSIDLLTRCYAGLETRCNKLWLHPQLPAEVRQMHFTLSYREHLLQVRSAPTELRIRSAPGDADPITVVVNGQEFVISTGDQLVVKV
jgi:HAD superfamily hydrolase (TIGR01509 family)